MSFPRRWISAAISAGVCAAAVAAGLNSTFADPAATDKTGLPPAAARKIDFVKDVQPIFVAACHACHGPDKQKSSYRLDSRGSALGEGDLGQAIVEGKSADSPLIHYVAGIDPMVVMPPRGARLTADQVGILRAWIDQGAEWPDSANAASVQPEAHWAFQPISNPPLPAVQDQRWPRTPIDAFILAKLEENGLSPAEPADRRTLLRRVTFDLTGAPPTPAEMQAFLEDASPGAYERVVDRLLASPRYGERWARHWMDIVHFAETHGNDQDRPRPNAWPYRDYVIRSFNDDKPYARFVEEQLAGDVLDPDNPWGIVATGFLAAGPWDESSQVNIMDDTVDKQIARNLDRDDMVTTALSTFSSVTVHCARCHNHKFDPISQAEYYNLQAVFAGIDRADRPYEPDPDIARTRRELLQEQTRLAGVRNSLDSELESAAVQATAAVWEAEFRARPQVWVVVNPAGMTSAEGATPVPQPDGSVLFSGMKPAFDTYTLTAPIDLMGVSAIRLELLTDDSLPHQGPGRQDNGNLHLSEFIVKAAPMSNPAATRPVVLQHATADFDQSGWTAAMAIDGNLATAWGIYPQVGKPHVAMFEIKEPLVGNGGQLLTFVLEQKHGGGHLIGRPRISVTNAPEAQRRNDVPLPEEITRILAVPLAERTAGQRGDLALYVLKRRVAERLESLPPPALVYAGAGDFKPDGNFRPAKQPRPVRILKRGDVRKPGEEAVPGALACVQGLESQFALTNPDNEGSRRAALARWLTDPKNALTWRSIVNRAWQYHFGAGIVTTPNDFGHMGSEPSHPELLDWLATSLQATGGSLKQLHRLLLTSATYRQSSRHNPEHARVDFENRLLWRMNRTRLDAESVRDAVLQITGRLDQRMGGPSVKQFIQSPGIHVTPMVDYLKFDVDSPESCRRSIYRFLFRTLPDPFMDSMDCADASQLTPRRTTSVTALQSLTMLNNHFIVRYSEHFAERVALAGPDLGQQIEAAYYLALARAPTGEELAAVRAYALKHGMANVCRLLLNSNEFMFLN